MSILDGDYHNNGLKDEKLRVTRHKEIFKVDRS